ncbi:MAG: Na+/H+ antiporter NhaA [Planctomycetota bacterium]|jgi:NhaA family Na+:H+ antiporter|nr:Na+/H+ antiporter NhaA [Planctomycetota bacterium]
MVTKRIKGTIHFLFENSLFLIFGTLVALIWANSGDAAFHKYHDLVHHEWIAHFFGEGGHHHLNLHWVVNDVLMAFFFAIAGKEIWEALLPGGPLNDPKKAATPLIATLGGMVGPAGVYLVGAMMLGKMATLSNGWAIPCATDIAFSYMVARIIFGAGHPAISFLLLLAIADDALGLLIIAIFYSTDVHPVWMVLPVIAMVVGFVFRRMHLKSFWWYLLIPGALSWYGFFKTGVHPALGLLPIIPTMPHAKTDLGIFMAKEMQRHDTLNEFEHWWKNPVELILCVFGFANAGVVMASVGDATWLVLGGLLVGKPVGIFLFGFVAAKGLGFGLPEGLNLKDLVVIGFAAAIGFTVALFVSDAAFGPLAKGPEKAIYGPILEAAKMGALGSFSAAILTLIVGKLMGVKKVAAKTGDTGHH